MPQKGEGSYSVNVTLTHSPTLFLYTLHFVFYLLLVTIPLCLTLTLPLPSPPFSLHCIQRDQLASWLCVRLTYKTQALLSIAMPLPLLVLLKPLLLVLSMLRFSNSNFKVRQFSTKLLT